MPSIALPLVIASLLAAPVPAAAAARALSRTEPDSPGSGAPIAAVVLRLDGVDVVALTDAFALRCPDRIVSDTARDAALGGRRFAFVDIRGEASGELTLSIVVSDGTAYFRTLPGDASQTTDDRVRVLAATLANLLAAIEESRVEPDAVNVPIPEQAPAEEPPPEPRGPDSNARHRDPDPPPLPPSKLSLVIDAAPAAVLAVGPVSPGGLAAMGGQLSADLRHDGGAMATLAVRGATRGIDASGERYRLGRARVSVGGGFARRVGLFELAAVLLVDVEPLWMTVAGTRASIAAPDGTAQRTFISVGGHARLSAVWTPQVATTRRPGAADGWVRLRVGPSVQVGGSGLVSGGVARLQRPAAGGPETLVRAGGLEIAVLFGVGVGFSLPTDPDRARKRQAHRP